MKLRFFKVIVPVFALFSVLLISAASAQNVSRPDIVVADFETETLDGWKAEGEAFQLREPGAQFRCGMGSVFGFHGKNLISTYAAPGADHAVGTLTSPEFKIERKYMTFLIGGGNFPGKTGIALYVDGQKAAEETGLFNVSMQGHEGLALKFWDVSEFQGKTAKLVIFDTQAGGDWGHIKADYICQTDFEPKNTGEILFQNTIACAADAKPVEFDRLIFGHFIEHFHRLVYDGIYEPGSPLSDENGFRKDVIEAVRDLKPSIVRWPGGCFASAYHWMDGVGPERKLVFDKVWRSEDPNTFGTAEFVKWCRLIGAEPYICGNAGTGTMEEISDWVEYCNLNIGHYGRMRQAHGFKEPFNVKYWSIGNENWGAHELGAKTPQEWGPWVREAAKLLYTTDPSVKVAAPATPSETWTIPLLQQAGRYIDYIAIHGYYDFVVHHNNTAPYIACMMRTQHPENHIVRTIAMLDKTGFRGKVHIAFDEWNLRSWHHPAFGSYPRIPTPEEHAARDKNDINSAYTMADGLFTACFLNSCLRHCEDVKMACFSPTVNGRGAIFTHPKGIVKRTTYHVYWMYANLLEKNILPIDLQSAPLLWENKSTPMIDAVLSVNDEGSRYVLAVVNKDPEKARPVTLELSKLPNGTPAKLEGTVLSGNSPDDFNDVGAENRVVPQKTVFEVKDGTVTLPPHSLSFIEIPVK